MRSHAIVLGVGSLMCLLTGCLTNERPTVVGQVVDAKTGRPVAGVIVSVHWLEIVPYHRGSPRPGDDVRESPEALVCATSYGDGNFFCKGEQRVEFLVTHERLYRVRLHRADYDDAIYNFVYQIEMPALFGNKKYVGRIPMTPVSSGADMIQSGGGGYDESN